MKVRQIDCVEIATAQASRDTTTNTSVTNDKHLRQLSECLDIREVGWELLLIPGNHTVNLRLTQIFGSCYRCSGDRLFPGQIRPFLIYVMA